MRNHYTVLSAPSGRKLPPPKKRNYPDSLDCEHCGKPFKPTKDRKRFCGKECFHGWEKAKALEAKPFGKPTGRTAKGMSAHSLKDFRKLDNPYADRCQHWMAEYEREIRRKSNLSGTREVRLPLVLTGHGISVCIESGSLRVRDGLTHHPQERNEFRYFPGKHNTPSRIVLLSQSGSVSVDALCWLSAQKIPLVVLDYQGNELVCICSSMGIADYEVRLAQLLATQKGSSLELARHLIRTKIAGQTANLELWPDGQTRRYVEHKLLKHLETVETVKSTGDLLILEATAALSYFKVWEEIPLNWSAKSIPMIPDEWFVMQQRQSKVSGINRNASHPVNSILNYGYAVLESQVRIAAAMYGLDVNVSYLHAMKHGRSSLIFDLMEPLRPRLDSRIFEFIRATKFTREDFALSIQGVCRLSPQFARRISLAALPDSEIQESVAEFRNNLLVLLKSPQDSRDKIVGKVQGPRTRRMAARRLPYREGRV